MAERGQEGPLFYRGMFHHKSVRSDQLSREQRIEYRGLYRTLLGSYGRTYQGKMKARATLRMMLYAELGWAK